MGIVVCIKSFVAPSGSCESKAHTPNSGEIRAISDRLEEVCHLETTDSNHSYRIYPNMTKDLIVTAVNQVWVADITYIRILTCFVYLAVILDRFSRKVIGWAIAKLLHRSLAIKALQMAIDERDPPEGCIHHSDQGVQYASDDSWLFDS